MARQSATRPAAPELAVSDRIDLDPRDYYAATWRNLPPLERPPGPPPTAFHLESSLRRLESVQLDAQGGWMLPTIPGPVSREEAHFWLTAFARAEKGRKPEEVSRELKQEMFTGQLDAQAVAGLVGQITQTGAIQSLETLVEALLDPVERIHFVLARPGWPSEPDSPGLGAAWSIRLTHWLLRDVVPYLTEEQRQAVRPVVIDRVRQSTWPTDDPSERPDPSFHAAAFLGLHDQVERVVTSWPDDLYNRHDWDDTCYHQTQLVVFGLGSADLVERHLRRLKLRLTIPRHVRCWLAHTGASALDYVVESILAAEDRNQAARLIEALALVRSPAAAGPMLRLKAESKAPEAAGAWLDRNLGNALAGLLPVAAGAGKSAEMARDFLRTANRSGHGDLLKALVSRADPAVASAIRKGVIDHVEGGYTPLEDRNTPAWLQNGLAHIGRPGELPTWLLVAGLLPPIVVGADACLNPEQVRVTLTALRRATPGVNSPLLRALKEHASGASLDAFTCELLEVWVARGEPASEKWMMEAVGFLGGQRSIARLTALIRAWPGQSQSARALQGLKCLAANGSDSALLAINGLAQKVKYKSLREAARDTLASLAKARGLTWTELEDRIVPDLSLDERGRKVLDFGPRQFTVVLGPDLTPLVRDGQALRKDLPKPGKKDDADKSARAVAEWKVLKKQLKEVAKQQAFRLEQAMIAGRRWSPDDFGRLLVGHPLLFLLAQRLLWAGYDKGGKIRLTFRVTEERQMVDVNDEPVSLDEVEGVGLPHPLHLGEDERAAWGQVFGEHELMSPFPQLARSTFGLEPGEETQKQITRFAALEIPGASVAGYLEGAGWEPGYKHDHGDYTEQSKFFPAADLTAVLQHEPGLLASMRFSSPDQQITGCCFFPGRPNIKVRMIDYSAALTLGAVDRVVLSEVLADLSNLAARAVP